MTTPDTPGLPVIPGDAVTPGDSVRLVLTGQEAQMGKNDKALDRTELPVLNSPDNPAQLERNVHMQQRTMPNLLVEHVSEYTEVGQDFMNSDSSNVKAYESSNRTQLPHFELCLLASVTPVTLWASATLVIGQTKSRGQLEADIILMSHVLLGEIVTHAVILFLSNMLIQVNILQLR